jgi:hypothetical protein
MTMLLMLVTMSLSALAGRTTPSVVGDDAAVAAGDTCPTPHGRAAERVRMLLSSPLAPEMRARYNLGTASASDVRLLTDQHDRVTCEALWNALEATGTNLSPGDRVSFYRSGDTFFVPVSRSRRPAQPGAVQLDGYSSLDVYDSTYRLVGRFGA